MAYLEDETWQAAIAEGDAMDMGMYLNLPTVIQEEQFNMEWTVWCKSHKNSCKPELLPGTFMRIQDSSVR